MTIQPSILSLVLTNQLDTLTIPKWKLINEQIFLLKVEEMEKEKVLINENGILIFDDISGFAKIFYEAGFPIGNITQELEKSGWKYCSDKSKLN